MENIRTSDELLRAQMARLGEIEFYRERFQKHGVRPEDVKSFADLVHLPFLTRRELEEECRELHPPLGRLFTEKVVRINLTPTTTGFLPIYFTGRDIEVTREVNARLYRAAGVRPDDLVANCMGYHVFIAGLLHNDGLEHLGAKVIPLGPGESERAVSVINQYGVSVLVSNPSFAVKLAQLGANKIRVLIAGGEPMAKEAIKAHFTQITVINSYGLAECSPVARECAEESGLHIADEYVYVEIVDPETGERLPEGEKGEIVITHLQREAMPLLRFRTGDLAVLIRKPCTCGRQISFPSGILGRTDQMVKVKGVKLYPSQVAAVAREFPGLTGKYQVKVSRRQGTDWLAITFEGEKKVDVDLLREKLKTTLIIVPNELGVVDCLAETGVFDERG